MAQKEQAAREQATAQLRSELKQLHEQVEKGQITWSYFYDQTWRKLTNSGQAPAGLLMNYNEAHLLSLKYEAGELSQEEWTYEMRRLAGERGRMREEEEAAHRQRVLAAYQYLQANQVKPNLLPQPYMLPTQQARPQVLQPTMPMPMPMPNRTSPTVTAQWTGQQRQVTTITHQTGWSCEYRYLSDVFWRTFINSCPSSIQIR